jgi:hypothetical protein
VWAMSLPPSIAEIFSTWPGLWTHRITVMRTLHMRAHWLSPASMHTAVPTDFSSINCVRTLVTDLVFKLVFLDCLVILRATPNPTQFLIDCLTFKLVFLDCLVILRDNQNPNIFFFFAALIHRALHVCT